MEKIHINNQGNIVIVTIDNPPMNALDAQVIDELEQAFEEIAKYDDLNAVVLTGEGKAFVAGADIKQFVGLKFEGGVKLTTRGQSVYRKIEEFPVPVICAINGYALGGGLELALSCDIRIADKKAKLGLPEATLGICPGYGGTQRLPRVVGKAMAKKMIFTGTPISADDAFSIGLCEQVSDEGKVVEDALLLAEKITKVAPISVRKIKKLMNEGMEMKLYDAIDYEAEVFGKLCETEDKEEGTKAFLEKRKPNFKGK
ncbi:MAG: enoyl-CoA hydratase-related protein [Tissierellia bacterium]|nr:enoyl-CoA hydratase-related protein [Tissierellia bacterium]